MKPSGDPRPQSRSDGAEAAVRFEPMGGGANGRRRAASTTHEIRSRMRPVRGNRDGSSSVADATQKSAGGVDPWAEAPRLPSSYRYAMTDESTWTARIQVCLSLVVALLAGCGKMSEGAKQGPPEVTVSEPAQQEVTDYVELTGTVTPSRSVDLMARVTGFLESVEFQDGATVKEGDELFVIEPEPYRQQLALAEAALERAKSEYNRQLSLIASNATSVANVERWRSENDQAVAQVALAKINLGYTRVTAPFTGLIGRRLVDGGNLVGPTVNTKLASMDQLEPIYVYFNLNERDTLQAVTIMRQQGLSPRSNIGKTTVFVGLQNQAGYPEEGTLDFADTGISTSSGTMQLRAVFPNKDRMLIAGAFARVRIPLGGPKPMLVVPANIIGNDQEGDYVLTVDAGGIVARRGVVLGPLTTNGCAIRSGLKAQDRVIVNGVMRAKPGDRVSPVTAPGAQSTPPSPTR